MVRLWPRSRPEPRRAVSRIPPPQRRRFKGDPKVAAPDSNLAAALTPASFGRRARAACSPARRSKAGPKAAEEQWGGSSPSTPAAAAGAGDSAKDFMAMRRRDLKENQVRLETDALFKAPE